MSPADFPSPDLEQARDELREGIELSRQLVRQSRVLIEMSESDGAFARDDEDWGLVN